jgi:GNAT superfamily N-acetyltransferase
MTRRHQPTARIKGAATGSVVSVSVRPRLPEDLPACGRVLAAVHAADRYPSRWPADTATWLSPPGLAAAWVAQHGSMIAGHVGMVQGVDDPVVSAITGAPPARLASLTRLFVDPIARGRKLGAALLETVHAYAAIQRLQLMLDVVDDGGPAIALYDRLGWRVVDHRIADWTTPEGRRLPVLVYVAPDGAPPAVP